MQRKLLLSSDDFITRLRSAPEGVLLPPARAVFIRACDRPGRLAHLLASLSDYERRHRANRRYVLIDDSVLAAHVNEQRDLFNEFARDRVQGQLHRPIKGSAKVVERIGKGRPAGRMNWRP